LGIVGNDIGKQWHYGKKSIHWVVIQCFGVGSVETAITAAAIAAAATTVAAAADSAAEESGCTTSSTSCTAGLLFAFVQVCL
jgi:hypothetical protein